MLKHVSFTTRHPERLTRFYEALGASLAKDTTAADGLRRLVLEFPGGGKLQFFVAEAGSQPASWMEHIAVRVPDLPGTVRALGEKGVRFSRPLHTSPGGNPVAFALDPDGRHVELLEG